MTDKLTEIRERHEKVYTTAKREGYYHDIDPEDAHDDRGYLLDRITELEADVVCLQERDDKYTNTITGLQTENTRLRTANTELNEWNKGIEAQLDKVRGFFDDWAAGRITTKTCLKMAQQAMESKDD